MMGSKVCHGEYRASFRSKAIHHRRILTYTKKYLRQDRPLTIPMQHLRVVPSAVVFTQPLNALFGPQSLRLADFLAAGAEITLSASDRTKLRTEFVRRLSDQQRRETLIGMPLPADWEADLSKPERIDVRRALAVLKISETQSLRRLTLGAFMDEVGGPLARTLSILARMEAIDWNADKAQACLNRLSAPREDVSIDVAPASAADALTQCDEARQIEELWPQVKAMGWISSIQAQDPRFAQFRLNAPLASWLLRAMKAPRRPRELLKVLLRALELNGTISVSLNQRQVEAQVNARLAAQTAAPLPPAGALEPDSASKPKRMRKRVGLGKRNASPSLPKPSSPVGATKPAKSKSGGQAAPLSQRAVRQQSTEAPLSDFRAPANHIEDGYSLKALPTAQRHDIGQNVFAQMAASLGGWGSRSS